MSASVPSEITDQQVESEQVPLRFSSDEVQQFQREGWQISRGIIPEALRVGMLEATLAGLAGEVPPVEFEAELNYPGSPESLHDRGGRTVRRLKQAHTRGEMFTRCLTLPALTERLHQLLGPQVFCPLAHHNCIMTKQPQFSSDTGWHQDIRYWSFPRPELISVWIALGQENEQNGCLKIIPGTHQLTPRPEQLDADLFLRPDLPENQPLIDTQQPVYLQPGDVLFFHARTFHSASRNHGSNSKFSVVFTFRGGDNPPLPGTRSASLPELLLPPVLPAAESSQPAGE